MSSPQPERRGRLLASAAWLATLGALPGLAQATPLENNPSAYDLRLGLFPVYFQGGISQSHLGSAGRAEFDVTRRLGLQAWARVPWANVAGNKDKDGLTLGGGLIVHVVEKVEREALSGTVYPEDTPAIQGAGPGADSDLEVPMHQKLGGPRMTVGDVDRSLSAAMRKLHSIRLGYQYVQAVQKVRGLDPALDASAYNRLHAFHLGYGWGTHWNLEPSRGGGKREVGWRRFYVDVTLTVKELTDSESLYNAPGLNGDFVPVGGRIGMEGAIAAFFDKTPGVGFAYSLEMGALPGRSGLEGYLFIGLGVEIDAATRAD